MRGVLTCLGLALIAVGLLFTFATWTVDGFTVLALVGVLILAEVWRREEADYAAEASDGSGS